MPYRWPAYNPGPAPKPKSPIYVERHPTRYFFKPSVARVAQKAIERFRGKISINTYESHPPLYPHYERVSLDVWDDRGRGYSLDRSIGWDVFYFFFNMPGEPDIEWAIYDGWMWVRRRGWVDAPPGPPDSDPDHRGHIHISYSLDS